MSNSAIFEFSEIEAFFWKSIKHHKHGFIGIISIRPPYKTFIFKDKNVVLTSVEIFELFTCSEK